MPNHTDDIIPPSLRLAYARILDEAAHTLEFCIRNCAKGKQISDEEKSNIADIAHKLAGSGKIYGFDDISDKGMALDRFLFESTMDTAIFLKLLTDLHSAIKTALETKE